jgi:signal transduction histidine kinase
VGIGASAGGLRALQHFVEAVPSDSGMCYVVILHLDPARESRLGELLQDRSGVPVTEVSGPTVVEGNRIYLIPPGHDLAMNGTTLGLRKRDPRAEHAPVDLFFRTLADTYGPDAVGVVLSGTGSDGTAGIRYIREAGGTTVAQSPDESEYDSMPASAIASGLIDLVLPAAEIPGELLRLRGQPSGLEEDGRASSDQEAGLARVFSTLRARTGHDFSQYRRAAMLRRLERRLRFNHVSTLADYVAILESSSAECQALLRDLVSSASSFFRDADAFAALAALAPALFEGKTSADTVRVWVVGCATGEEAYSVAMVLAEQAAALPDPPRLQLFATDIDEKGYASGRAGLYTAAAVAAIPEGRLDRFFTREAGGFRIATSLRELVLFAGHNILHDPPFSHIDLVSCRNLVIYLQPGAQERVLETFYFALNPRGLLFLGAAESAGEGGRFEAIGDGAHRLFRRSATPYPVASLPAPAESATTLVKGTFLATLSHEFRTPLNAILGYADLLELTGALGVPQAEQVARIKAAGWHLASMIDEILTFARLDGGHAAIEPEPVDTRMLVREAAAVTEVAASAKGLEVVLDLPDTPLRVETDVDKARQILTNLLGNAIKFSHEGEVRMAATLEADRVVFHVTDTGIGIAPEHQAQIFERFWQVDGGATRVAGGMGIGLAAAREYARLLGGDVEVASAPGRGSTFTFWLPR